MHRTPAARPFLAFALSAALGLTVAACYAGGLDSARPAATPPATAQSPAALPSPAVPPALTRDQARAALITEADFGGSWEQTQGAATWRDELLKATTDNAECRRLLDVLYTEELFAAAPEPRATAALDEGVDGTQLHYRITAHRAADLDRTLAWLETLSSTCGRFTATTEGGEELEVQVSDMPLPEVGDVGRGLRVMVHAEDVVLTMDLAAVRLGDDAISVTNGGVGEVTQEAVWRAVEVGTARLTEIRRQGRVQV
ncbi:hypothetical protein ACWD00_04335 [Streptomyces viridiviolaceus]